MTNFVTTEYHKHLSPPGPEGVMTEIVYKETNYWRTVDETEDPFDVVLHREGGQPAVIWQKLNDAGEKELEFGHQYFENGKAYRVDGPTSVQGEEIIALEYEYGDFTLDVALQVAHSQGLITDQELKNGLDAYEELPRYMERGNNVFSKENFPYKKQTRKIMNLINKANKKS